MSKTSGKSDESRSTRFVLPHQGDNVGDDSHRKGNGQPAVNLPNPHIPIHGTSF